MAKARDLLLRGRVLTGKEAHDIGLITHVRPHDEVLSEARAIARELAELPPYAVAWTKLSVNKSIKEHLNQGIDASMALEMLTMLSNDHAAAVQAFVEKRKPEFKGD